MKKTYFVKSSRKKAKARCKVSKGAGNIHINNAPVDSKYHGYKKEIIKEPLYILPEEASVLDFFINVKGGGVSAQAQAIRSCIAKGILIANNNKESIRDKLIEYDRRLLVDDVRQKETVKQLGRGARSKKQHSKR
jgi:small subunit ribosomal protein S9